MTLHRQLFIILTLILSSLSLLTITIAFKATQRHLTEQQHIELNNTAHAIGFVLKPVISSKSISHIDSLLSSFFDSGYYQSVKLSFKDGRPSIHHQYDEKSIPVPTWFRHYFALEPVQRTVSISSGWTIDGALTIKSNSTFAYIRLWNTTLAFVVFGALFTMIGLIAFHLVLTRTLKPLNALTEHVSDFRINRVYKPLEPPKTKEVATLVTSFNNMSRQLDNFIGELESNASQLCQTAYIDNHTGISNRTYILESIEHSIQNQLNSNLAVIQFPELAKLKDEKKFEALNTKLLNIIELISQLSLVGIVIAKLSDIEIAMVDGLGEDPTFDKKVQSTVELLTKEVSDDISCISVALNGYSSVKEVLIDIDKKLGEV